VKPTVLNGSFLIGLPEKKHVPSLYEVIQREQEYLHEWRDFVAKCSSLNQTHRFISENRRAFDQILQPAKDRMHPGFHLAITDGEFDIVGMVGFQGIHLVNNIASIGYWVSQNYAGKGLITHATDWLMQYGKEVLDINRFEIQCRIDNLKSAGVPKRLDFSEEGVLREYEKLQDSQEYIDHVLFSKLSSEM
jgi:ribosomal-protein-serine acetyltransferase